MLSDDAVPPKSSSEARLRVKDWATQHLAAQGDNIIVTELLCQDPGLPPRETVIVIAGREGSRQHRLRRPACDVVEADVAEIAERLSTRSFS